MFSTAPAPLLRGTDHGASVVLNICAGDLADLAMYARLLGLRADADSAALEREGVHLLLRVRAVHLFDKCGNVRRRVCGAHYLQKMQI